MFFIKAHDVIDIEIRSEGHKCIGKIQWNVLILFHQAFRKREAFNA